MTHKAIVSGYTAVIGAIGGVFLTLFGDWNVALTILCICMAIDYVTGLVVAGVFHASRKSAGGGLDSNAGWKGLIRKVATLVIILIAHFVDLLIGTEYIRDAVVIAFTVNEILSILENCALMGVPIPNVLLKGIDVLKQQGEDKPDTSLTWEEYQKDPEKYQTDEHVIPTVIAYQKYDEEESKPGGDFENGGETKT